MSWVWRKLAFLFLKLLIWLEFPGVQHITTKKLARWLESPRSQPLLLDARSVEEYAVSHLQSAQRIDPVAPDLAAFVGVPLDVPIVVYCSVGYRSAKIAQQLQGMGRKNVLNLEGSIFQWVNEGRPVFNGESLTGGVHPYDERWGGLLRRGETRRDAEVARRGAEG